MTDSNLVHVQCDPKGAPKQQRSGQAPGSTSNAATPPCVSTYVFVLALICVTGGQACVRLEPVPTRWAETKTMIKVDDVFH